MRIAVTRGHLLAALLALPLFADGQAAAIEFAPAAVGTRFEYECNSNIPNPINPARTAEISIKSVDDSTVVYKQMINGSPRLEIRQPRSLYGTTLVEQLSTRQGTGKALAGLDKFPSLRDLKVGSKHEGTIQWMGINGKESTYQVTLQVSDQEKYRTIPFGYIHVIVLEETWKGPRNTIKQLTYISPEKSAVVGWDYRINNWGSEECWLSGVRAL
jgi:phage-related protein